MQDLPQFGIILLVAAFIALIMQLPGRVRDIRLSKKKEQDMSTQASNTPKPLIVVGICAVTALATGLFGFYAGTFAKGVDASAIPVNWIASAVVPAIVTIVAVFAVHRMLAQTRKSHDEFNKILKDNSENLVSTVREVCLPNMHSLSGPYAVMEDATDMIGQATADRETLWYYGTSNLTKHEDRLEDTQELQDTREEYRSAMSLAHTEQIPIIRFIALDSAVDFALRLESDQEEYKNWILHQINLMEKNKGYELYHSLRAPRMGASSHTIATKDSMILMVGNGTLGLRINGESIVRPFRDNWTRMFEGKSGKPQKYSAERLKRYLKDELKLPPTVHQLPDGESLVESLVAQLQKVVGAKKGGIVYVGSGGLLASGGLLSSSASDRYEHVMQDLQDQNIPFDRYICLLGETDFLSRSADTQKRYLQWLEKQIQILKEYDEYSFYNSPRAVPWGSTKSCIFTPFGYFEVVGNGMRGLFVSGEELSRACEAATRIALDENAFKKPDKYTATRLQTYFDGLDAAQKGKPKADIKAAPTSRTRKSASN